MGMIWEENRSCYNGNLCSCHDQIHPDEFYQMLQAYNCFNCNGVLQHKHVPHLTAETVN
jgi:hypothetical protein